MSDRTEINDDNGAVDTEKYFRATLKDKGYIVVETNGDLLAFAQKDIKSIYLCENELLRVEVGDFHYNMDQKELIKQLKVLK